MMLVHSCCDFSFLWRLAILCFYLVVVVCRKVARAQNWLKLQIVFLSLALRCIKQRNLKEHS